MNTVRETAEALRADAVAANERRLLVLCGSRKRCYTAAETVAETFGAGHSILTVSDRGIVGERVEYGRTDTLLGTTNDCVVIDCHDTCRPNALGRATGSVDGGGLLVMLTPPLSAWERTHGRFGETLAPPPFSVEDVGSRFGRHLIGTLRSHAGVSIVNVDTGTRTKHEPIGNTRGRSRAPIEAPDEHAFPEAAYDACVRADQRDALKACERLSEPGRAVVLRSDRGRGKSSAAGLAAAGFALEGETVVVTAPGYRNAAEVFDRAGELLRSLGEMCEDGTDGGTQPFLRTRTGNIQFRTPQEATRESCDVLFVDEAAAIPVRTLEALLSVAPSACFSTTVRGYEGAGRGFDIRFRETLERGHDVTTVVLSEPIRYAAADPIEVWLFHALLFDSTPPPAELLEGTAVAETEYERLDRDRLARNEPLLRELFGLLVHGHYRTQPDDLARLLDAPEIEIRALTADGHPVSVALLAREGGLDERTRRTAYEGDRIRGNLIPDLLTSQLRDLEAGVPVGYRVLRIVTQSAVRSAGFGSRLLGEIEAELTGRTTAKGTTSGTAFERNATDGDEPIDYLGVSYGATPRLLRFWATSGYRTVHVSTTRNDASGEHSAVMLNPLSETGAELAKRHAEWFRRRIPSVLSGPLGSLDPDIVRAALAATDGAVRIELTDLEWRLVASAAYGPGHYDTAPEPFRRLALAALVDRFLDDADAERLLVVRVLQNASWEATTARLGYVSERECKRALGAAYRPIVERYGDGTARTEADRFGG